MRAGDSHPSRAVTNVRVEDVPEEGPDIICVHWKIQMNIGVPDVALQDWKLVSEKPCRISKNQHVPNINL